MMQRKTMTTINIRQIQIKKYIYESKSDFWTKKLKNLVESTFLKIANTLMYLKPIGMSSPKSTLGWSLFKKMVLANFFKITDTLMYLVHSNKFRR